MKYWLVLVPNTDWVAGNTAHITFGTVQELISYATSSNELIEDELAVYFSYILGVDGKMHPEILKVIEQKLCEIRERMENSPFKILKGKIWMKSHPVS